MDKMVNVTKHALERYALRFKKVPYNEVKHKAFENKELYSEELNKMFNNSKLIYNGKISGKMTNNTNNTNEEVNYRLAGDICLVLDTVESKIITLYRVDFGFDMKTNRVILSSLIENLEEAETLHLEAMESTRQQKDALSLQALQLEEEINNLKMALKSLEENLQNIKSLEKEISSEEIISKLNYDKIAKQIVYSINYKKAMEEEI